MAHIDFRPRVIDLLTYSGDTVTIKITVPAGPINGFLWSGHVRANRSSSAVAAQFVITPPPSPGMPAYAVLQSVSTTALGGASKTFNGEYDIQVKHPTSDDPVYTLLQGAITVSPDVTRPDEAA